MLLTNTQIAGKLITLANQLYSANKFEDAELCRVAGLRLVGKLDYYRPEGEESIEDE